MSAPRARLFDAMGTLVALRPPGVELVRLLAARHGVRLEIPVAEAAFRREIAHYRANLMRAVDAASLAALRAECAEVLRDALPPLPDGIDMTGLMLDALRFDAYPDALPALRRARAAGARTFVVSNWDVSLHDVLRRTGLAGELDGAISSAQAGVAKPDPGIFAAALALAGCGPEQARHHGDSLEEDLAGARAAGIPFVLVCRDGRPGPPGVVSVRSLDEVP